ncbi:hypothetical protein BH11MYX1_BH11MYX1_19090 [soil metagenome]
MKALVLACLVAACRDSPPAASSIAVHIDHRVETIAALSWLAHPLELDAGGGIPRYNAELSTALAPFAKHPAVEMTRDLLAKGIAFEQPMELAIRLDDTLHLVDPQLPERWAGIDVPAYLVQVRAFATEAKLEAFFAAHQPYFTQVEAVFRTALAAHDPAPFFTKLFGPSPFAFTVVPALLQGPQSYGVHSGSAAYQLIGLGTLDRESLPTLIDDALIAHEIAHAYVNPVVERHWDELAPAATSLYALLAAQLTPQHYTTPKIMVDEAIVRAIATHYVRQAHGDPAAAAATREEVRRGFVFDAELERVIANGPNLEALMPALVEFFATAAKHGLPAVGFLGPINAIYTGPIAIIASPAMESYARAIDDQLFSGRWPVLHALAYAPQEIERASIVAYGTPITNASIAQTLARAGWKIGTDGITLGSKHFAGDHLVLIACWPRDDDPSRGIVVYTGATEADLSEVNALRAGATDWVVGRRDSPDHWTIIAKGDFVHAADGAWKLP